jgi:hypothetical protein
MPLRDTANALARLAEGLQYQSETDAPWEAVDWPDATGEPTAAEVSRRGKHKPRAPAAQQSVDAFFAPLVQEQDWFGEEEKATALKYRSLLDEVKKRLRAATVIEIGKRQATVYVVGVANEGGWAGLKTTEVQT